MNVKKILCKSLLSTSNSFAMASANTRCIWIAHQPKAPEALSKLSKIK